VKFVASLRNARRGGRRVCSRVCPTHRRFKQGCAVWCDASLPAEREQGIRPAMLGHPRRARQAPLTRRPRRSAPAVHITCRFASTTATNPRANADTLPNANPSAMTATRPSSRVAALFVPSQHDSFYLAVSREAAGFMCSTGAGFLRVPDDNKLGFVDFRGNG
jgi:hypothetical protein